jgi:hypothetical protein
MAAAALASAQGLKRQARDIAMRSMSPHRVLEFLAGTIVAGLLCAGSVSAYTYSAYTTMTGAKTIALNPFLYLEDSSDRATSGADLVIALGMLDNLDIYANLAGFYGLNGLPDANPYYSSWIMPRFDFGNTRIVALQLGITLDEDDRARFYIGPQYHFFRENDAFALEANAMFYSKNNPVTANPWAGATIGPVWKAIPDVLFPYLEVNPGYDFGDDSTDGTFDLAIAPGICLAFPNTAHQLSISFPISGLVAGEATVGIAVWCWLSFGGAEE